MPCDGNFGCTQTPHCCDQIHIKAEDPNYPFAVAFGEFTEAAERNYCEILAWMAAEGVEGFYIDHGGWPQRAVFKTSNGAIQFKLRWC